MTVNLIHTIDSAIAGTEDRATRDWTAIKAISEDGFVFIDEDTVDKIAMLVDSQRLTNGEFVAAYAYEENDGHASYVSAFGPSLLPTQVQDQIRDRLAAGNNGKEAARLFDLVIRLGLQISFQGKEFTAPYIKAVNWIADEVEINRTASNMARMFTNLGLGGWNEDNASLNVPLDIFAKAVNDNGHQTEMPERLQAFIECARRNNSTHVYWA